MAGILDIMRIVAKELGVNAVPTAESAFAAAKAFETKGALRVANEAATGGFSAVKGVIEGAPNLRNLSAPKAFEQYAPPFHVSAGHSIEMAPIAEVMKQRATNPEAYLAARAAARSEVAMPRAIVALESGEKAPPLVDLVRELSKGAKFDGAVVARKDGLTSVRFEGESFKGTQALIDDSSIVLEHAGRLSEHPLIPQAGFQKMGNRFVNG